MDSAPAAMEEKDESAGAEEVFGRVVEWAKSIPTPTAGIFMDEKTSRIRLGKAWPSGCTERQKQPASKLDGFDEMAASVLRHLGLD